MLLSRPIKKNIQQKKVDEKSLEREKYIKMDKKCYESFLRKRNFLKNPFICNYQNLDYYMKKKFLGWIVKHSSAECCWCSTTSSNAIYLLSRIFNVRYENLLIVRIEGTDGIIYKRANDYIKPENLICDGKCGNTHYPNAEIEFDFHSVLIYSKKKIDNVNFNVNNCVVFDINDGSPSLLGISFNDYLDICFPYDIELNIKIKKFSEEQFSSIIIKDMYLNRIDKIGRYF